MNLMTLLVAGLGLLLVGSSPQRSATVQERPSTLIVGDFPPLPPTLQELFDKSDVVVRAEVARTFPPRPEARGTRIIPNRPQQLKVTEVFRGDASLLRTQIVVRQAGGTIEHEGRLIAVEDSMRVFEQGDDVLLFLRRVKGTTFDVNYGPGGAIWLDSAGTAVIPTKLRSMPELRNERHMPATELVSLMRKLAKAHLQLGGGDLRR
jgi:hypothetical protein